MNGKGGGTNRLQPLLQDYKENNIQKYNNMIFNFRIVSDEVENFKREIKIDADATFLDLKNAICESVDFDKNQMSSFFICDDNWEKEKEITLEDMGSDSDQDVYLMENTVLSDMIDDEGQRLMFTFDYMTDRSFFMEMKELIPGKNLMDPICSLSLGKARRQGCLRSSCRSRGYGRRVLRLGVI